MCVWLVRAGLGRPAVVKRVETGFQQIEGHTNGSVPFSITFDNVTILWTADLLSCARFRTCMWRISNAEDPPNIPALRSSTACIVWSRASPRALLPTPPHHVPVPEYTMYLHRFARVKEKMWNGFLVQFWHRETTVSPRNHALFFKPPCKYLRHYSMVERLQLSVQTATGPDSHWCFVWTVTARSRPVASFTALRNMQASAIDLGKRRSNLTAT